MAVLAGKGGNPSAVADAIQLGSVNSSLILGFGLAKGIHCPAGAVGSYRRMSGNPLLLYKRIGPSLSDVCIAWALAIRAIQVIANTNAQAIQAVQVTANANAQAIQAIQVAAAAFALAVTRMPLTAAWIPLRVPTTGPIQGGAVQQQANWQSLSCKVRHRRFLELSLQQRVTRLKYRFVRK